MPRAAEEILEYSALYGRAVSHFHLPSLGVNEVMDHKDCNNPRY